MRITVVSHAAVIPINQEPFDALARAGADVTVIAPMSLRTDIRGTITLTELDGSAAKLIGLPVHLGGHARVLGGQRGIHVIHYGGLRASLTASRPDVVFVEEEPFSFAARQCMRAAGTTPFVVHENQNIARRLPLPFQQIRRSVLRSAAGVTVRNAVAEGIVRRFGYTGPVHLFPHGVDPARYPSRGDARRTVGFVGRLVEEKGILDLIDAVARLDDVSLLVVGDGPARGAAEARAAGAGLKATFTGSLPHDEVPGRYGHMTVVAIPSRTTPTWKEQFGRIVIEANAAGVPCVVSDSGELSATIAATDGGVVVPEGSVAALTDALRELLDDPARVRALGDAGRAAVAEHFTPDGLARDLLAFLAEVAR